MKKSLRISITGKILSIYNTESDYILFKTSNNELIPIDVNEQRNQIKNKLKKSIGNYIKIKALVSVRETGKLFVNVLKIKCSKKKKTLRRNQRFFMSELYDHVA